MPSVDIIVWSALSGLILIMLTIIGWLVKTGFDGLRSELKAMWDKLNQSHDEMTTIKVEIAEIKANCKAQREAGIHSHVHP